MKKYDTQISDILQDTLQTEESEHLLSNLHVGDLIDLADTNDNILKIFSDDKTETLKLSSQDGWTEGGIDNGWQSYSATYNDDSITLLLKGINIEFY